jgi:hypothetical protein
VARCRDAAQNAFTHRIISCADWYGTCDLFISYSRLDGGPFWGPRSDDGAALPGGDRRAAKSAYGALELVPIVSAQILARALETLKERGFLIAGPDSVAAACRWRAVRRLGGRQLAVSASRSEPTTCGSGKWRRSSSGGTHSARDRPIFKALNLQPRSPCERPEIAWPCLLQVARSFLFDGNLIPGTTNKSRCTRQSSHVESNALPLSRLAEAARRQ